MSAQNGSSVASTSTAKPSILQALAARSAHLPSKPRSGNFNQQDDFISFSELLDDEESSSSNARGGAARRGDFSGKGKGRFDERLDGRRGKKRPIADVLEEQGKRKLKDTEKTTPWTLDVDWDSHPSATEQLTAEIKAFAKYITPTDQEHDLRTCVVESIRRLFTRRWPLAQLHPFGSFMTKLYLPTGDIDLVCVIPSIPGPENKIAQTRVLREMQTLLRQSQLGRDIIVIGKARVPIIKFASTQGGFKIDISINMTNSIKVYPRVLQLFDQVGEETARALVMIVKAFLNQRQMNEVHSGGLGSYSIICLVVSFLQMHPRLQRKEIDPSDNLGTLLIEFLEVYGRNFNYDDVGICLSGRGSYYSKNRRGWQSSQRGKLTLSIEDPADPENDVSSGSYNMNLVRQSIAGAFEVLTASVYYRTSIILARLANAQSGVQLHKLSGRALPHATGEEGTDSDVDECRKSLLGAILGVTSEIEQSRYNVKRLAELGTVHRELNIPMNTYDEDGMLYDSSKPKQKKKAKAPPPPKGHIRFPPEPSAPPPPPPPASPRQHKQRKVPARAPSPDGSDMDIESPPDSVPASAPPSKKAKTSAASINLTASPPPPTKAKPAASKSIEARNYIDLDSPSPPPEDLPVETTAKRSGNPEEDSRYSVKKGKKRAEPERISYVPAGESSSEEEEGGREEGEASDDDGDSSVIISVDGEDSEDQYKPNGSAAAKSSKRKQRGLRKGDSSQEAPRTRSRTLSQSQGNRKQKGKADTVDRRRSSSNSSDGGDSKETKSPKKPKSSGPTPPNMAARRRREYWQSKGQVTRNLTSDEDSDEVYVVSKPTEAE